MITLYHCDGARSFRPLWMLEEMGLPYELKMLPFPPRVLAKEYLAINPLGTIPFMVDGETKMTESSGICYYLGTKYGPTPLVVGLDDPAYGVFGPRRSEKRYRCERLAGVPDCPQSEKGNAR